MADSRANSAYKGRIEPMRIVVAGSSGLIGTALCRSLAADGHEIVRLVRREPTAADEVRWDPARGALDSAALRGADGVVNLAGAPLGDKRWTTAYKRVILSSRVGSTRTIAETMARANSPPPVLVSASGMSFYGADQGDRILDEGDPPGTGFLSGVVRDWEAATSAAESAGIQVYHLRSGLVMSRASGAFARMLPFFRLGLGGRLGNGRQYWSYISVVDEVRAIRFLLEARAPAGPYNLTAPHPVTNAEFTRVLSRYLHRPALIPVPAIALRLVLGEIAQDVLGSLRVMPNALVKAGFQHQHPDAESVVRAALTAGRGHPKSHD